MLHLLTAWLPVGLIYTTVGSVKGNFWIIPELSIDRMIPFTPFGVWFYMLFYFYVPYTFLTTNARKVIPLQLSFIQCAIFRGTFPSTITYPAIETEDLSSRCLKFISFYDTGQNCFPSLHGSLLTCCSIANWNNNRRAQNIVGVIITLLMCYSIVAVKRHLFMDLSSGVLLAILTWRISLFLPIARFQYLAVQ